MNTRQREISCLMIAICFFLLSLGLLYNSNGKDKNNENSLTDNTDNVKTNFYNLGYVSCMFDVMDIIEKEGIGSVTNFLNKKSKELK